MTACLYNATLLVSTCTEHKLNLTAEEHINWLFFKTAQLVHNQPVHFYKHNSQIKKDTKMWLILCRFFLLYLDYCGTDRTSAGRRSKLTRSPKDKKNIIKFHRAVISTMNVTIILTDLREVHGARRRRCAPASELCSCTWGCGPSTCPPCTV